ncbi:MAG TPA: hypothetical protein VN763_01825 [Saprospiraceae bacterium]|nr:hypothetical protein [Saprospiraceae bacterium]
MITHWFTREEPSVIRPDRLSKNSLWHQVKFLHDEELPYATGDLLVISFDRKMSARVKKNLYQFSATPHNALTIVDCGNFNQKDPETLLPVLREIRSSGAMVLLLGPPLGFMRFQVEEAQMASIVRESNLDDDIHLRSLAPGPLFQYIGTQRHLVSESHLRVEGHIRLSDLKDDLSLAEPCIRDSGVMIFNCDSMSAAEVGYITGMSGSGFSVIEACQLFRYAGAAQSLYSTGIYGYSLEADHSGMMANAIAQMIWYLLEGSMLREDPEKSHLTQYFVQAKDHEHVIQFYKSELSGRWWLESKSGRKVPCSYKDYRRACEEDYSDLIIKSVIG